MMSGLARELLFDLVGNVAEAQHSEYRFVTISHGQPADLIRFYDVDREVDVIF